MKKLLNNFANNWHTWIGVTLSIPILIIGITAILLSHKDLMKGKKYEKNEKTYLSMLNLSDVHSVVIDQDETIWFGTKKGLYASVNGKASLQSLNDSKEEEQPEIEHLALLHKRLFILTEDAVYRRSNNRIEKVKEGEFSDITEIGASDILLLGKNELLRSHDYGDSWKEDEQLSDMAETLPFVKKVKKEMKDGKEKKEFKKIVKDLHTGKIFGKKYMWLWGDITGGACVFLVLTGLYMWVKKIRKKRALIKS
jgi:hypothetical protein